MVQVGAPLMTTGQLNAASLDNEIMSTPPAPMVSGCGPLTENAAVVSSTVKLSTVMFVPRKLERFAVERYENVTSLTLAGVMFEIQFAAFVQ